MPRRFSRNLVILALLLSLGWNWGVLQLAAWAIMIQERSPQMGLVSAFASVISGEEPCHRCKAISDQRGEERPLPAKLMDQGGKWHFAGESSGQFIALRPPVIMVLREDFVTLALNPFPQPPSPPPKLRA